MSKRANVARYVEAIRVDDDDEVFAECLKLLAKRALEHAMTEAADDPDRVLGALCGTTTATAEGEAATKSGASGSGAGAGGGGGQDPAPPGRGY